MRAWALQSAGYVKGGDKETQEDLAQDASIALYKVFAGNIPDWSIARLRAYIRATVAHLAINDWRRGARSREAYLEDVFADSPDRAQDVEAIAFANALITQCQKWVDALPERDRVIYETITNCSHSVAEVARRLAPKLDMPAASIEREYRRLRGRVVAEVLAPWEDA